MIDPKDAEIVDLKRQIDEIETLWSTWVRVAHENRDAYEDEITALKLQAEKAEGRDRKGVMIEATCPHCGKTVDVYEFQLPPEKIPTTQILRDWIQKRGYATDAGVSSIDGLLMAYTVSRIADAQERIAAALEERNHPISDAIRAEREGCIRLLETGIKHNRPMEEVLQAVRKRRQNDAE